jgi:hypothetical protein
VLSCISTATRMGTSKYSPRASKSVPSGCIEAQRQNAQARRSLSAVAYIYWKQEYPSACRQDKSTEVPELARGYWNPVSLFGVQGVHLRMRTDNSRNEYATDISLHSTVSRSKRTRRSARPRSVYRTVQVSIEVLRNNKRYTRVITTPHTDHVTTS